PAAKVVFYRRNHRCLLHREPSEAVGRSTLDRGMLATTTSLIAPQQPLSPTGLSPSVPLTCPKMDLELSDERFHAAVPPPRIGPSLPATELRNFPGSSYLTELPARSPTALAHLQARRPVSMLIVNHTPARRPYLQVTAHAKLSASPRRRRGAA